MGLVITNKEPARDIRPGRLVCVVREKHIHIDHQKGFRLGVWQCLVLQLLLLDHHLPHQSLATAVQMRSCFSIFSSAIYISFQLFISVMNVIFSITEISVNPKIYMNNIIVFIVTKYIDKYKTGKGGICECQSFIPGVHGLQQVYYWGGGAGGWGVQHED